MRKLVMSSKEVKQEFNVKVVSSEVEAEMVKRGYVKSRSNEFPFGYVYELKGSEISNKRISSEEMISQYLARGGRVEKCKDHKPSSSQSPKKAKNKHFVSDKHYKSIKHS